MTHNFSLLLVDDDPTVIAALGSMLEPVGRLRFATSGAQALLLARQAPPDLVLLDIEMPGMRGFDVLTAMQDDPALADVPIIFITAHEGSELEVEALNCGAADFIAKPPRPAQVVARVRMHLRMKQMADTLRHAAYLDGLTGIANRRQFEERLHCEWLRSRRAGTPLSLLMLDIDAFKPYNDHYGHPRGDACLRAVAQAVQRTLQRPGDLAARYGGEEFAVLLPDTDAAGARFLATQVLQAVDALQLPHAASPTAAQVSVSIGVSTQARTQATAGSAESPSDPGATTLLAAADQALYAAKTGGRHQARFLALCDVGAPERALDLRRLPVAAQGGLATCA